ncbi:hypothetical protein PB2503_06122 [Parvularcula bermudensis HTCC2503]|uniref:Uncharacterized protein n=1 Tax=Parvularcula bermudensis (strain ATCC BAA-594 / HTCC2503 / KCTC 12087) TaxID=314260 RepID=E0THJ6_PARBH|nr:PD-(D/E)XK nuclease family protein [Parvularcula bermudensis]ADM09292.1 hypothetical protein PB2503_06122 [Parvularcula bermudensis HTCC2503]
MNGLKFDDVIIHPKLKSGGYADLLVHASGDGLKYALLIEHKIGAGPATRQAKRYADHAEYLRSKGVKAATLLIAPQNYVGEKDDYDKSFSLEEMIEIMSSKDNLRLKYRRKRIKAAIKKQASSGVQIPDIAVKELHIRYKEVAEEWCRRESVSFQFPPIKEEYYDEDSWIERIKHPRLPSHITLRHRLWMSVGHELGSVDLFLKTPNEAEISRIMNDRPVGSKPYNPKENPQVSFEVSALKPHKKFSQETVEHACERMVELVDWYTK